MDDELKNTDWYDKHPQEAIYNIFTQPDFESGFTAFKFLMKQYPELEIDWVDTFTKFKSLLLNTEKIDEILHFIEWISEKDIDYQYKFEYVEQDLCSYFLFKNDSGRLGDRVDFLQKHPILAFDTLTQPLLFELIYHGHYNLAVSFSQAVWKPVSKSEELIADSEYPFVITLYVNRLQEMYEAWKENGLFDEASFKNYITGLGFELDPAIFNRNLECLKTTLDISMIEESIKNITSEYLVILNINFLKYMLEKYNFPFIVSVHFWNMVNSATLFGEKKKMDQWFFVNANKLKEHVEYSTSFYDTNLLEVFGKVWGLDYVYRFLYDQKLIKMEDYEIMQTNILSIKKDLIERADYDLWQMTFIFKWPRVSDLADFEKEEDFRAAFGMTEEEILEEWDMISYGEDYEEFNEDFLGDDDDMEQDYTPRVPFVRDGPKIGRNDPCPCGSGKKYKKCCGGG
jgi:hypothetical protein